MPINIPQIKRADPVPQGSVGRDQTQAPSAEPYLKNLNTLTSVIDKSADLAFKYEKQAQDSSVRDLTNKYKAALYGTGDEKESWSVTRFQKTPKEGQDFTQAFAGYQSHKQSLRDKIMTDVSGGVAAKLQTQLADVDFYADRTVNVEFYKANNVRDKSIYEAEIDLIKQVDIPAAVGAFNPKDPDTVLQLNTVFDKIADSSQSHGIKLGFKEGDKILQDMMRKDVGDAVVKSVNDALSVKDTDKATALWFNYEKMIPNQQAEPLKKKIADIVTDKEIDTWANKYTGLSENVGMAKIQKEAPEQLKEEIQDRYIKLMTRKSEQLSRISEQAKNVTAADFLRRQQGGTAPLTAREIESTYGDALKNMNVGDRQYIYNMVNSRNKVGDYDTYRTIVDAFERNDPAVKSWNINDIMRNTVNLNQKQFGTVISKWEKRNDWSESHAEVMRFVKQSTKLSQLSLDGVTEYSAQQEEKWGTYIRPWLTNQIQNLPTTMTQSRIEQESSRLKKDVYKMLNEIKSNKRNDNDVFKFQAITQPANQAIKSPPIGVIPSTNQVDNIRSQYKTKPKQGQ